LNLNSQFFKKQAKVLFGDSIVFSQASFCLAPKILDAVYMIEVLLGKMSAVVDAKMVKS